MKFAKNRIAIIAIAIFLMLSMTASMLLIPTASAHTPPWQITTFAYIFAAPNPVGEGQQIVVFMWLDKTMQGAALTNQARFENYQLVITAPDGTNTTQSWPIVEDTTSAQSYYFTPLQVGTYTLTFNFPGQVISAYDGSQAGFPGNPPPSAYVNDTYLPSTASTTLTVQQAQLTNIPNTPLPTDYWMRPIYGENTEWYAISSNWLGVGAPGYGGTSGPDENMFSGDSIGSLTSHIMWTTPLQSGGVVGGGNNLAVPGDTYFDGSAYIIRYNNPIILDGMLYYTEPLGYNAPEAISSDGGPPYGPTNCVNLETGQLVWSSTNVPPLMFGYIYDMQTVNEHGVMPPILVAAPDNAPFTTYSPLWELFDADTGTWLCNVTNIPAGTVVLGPSGEQLVYTFANDGTPTKPQYYLSQWNSSDLFFPDGAQAPIMSGTIDANVPSAYDWNISIPWLNSMPAAAPGVFPITIDAAFYNNMMICYNCTESSVILGGSHPTLGGIGYTMGVPYTYFGVNLNPAQGSIGTILWTNTLTPPTNDVTIEFGGADPTVGVFTELYRETMQYVGYNMTTGQQIWGPTGGETALNYYGSTSAGDTSTQCAYGNLYSSGYGGVLYCYSLTTGNLLWTFGNGGTGNSTDAGLNNAYGVYPIFMQAVGNGVLYTITSAHTATTPIYKGALARAINATTGQEIWTLSDYTTEFGSESYAMADGYNTWFNGYDNQIYTVGRGPSETTVQAPLTAIAEGNNVVIQGTVMDISAGTQQTEQKADFPNGVPCASDASMTDWMAYVYQQQPLPTNFTGVTVTLTAIDPNGNYITLGNATTDANGLFSLAWQTPQVSGKYTITATFSGTNGYWGSDAETAMVVQNGPSATAAPTATPTSAVNLYFVPAIVGLFVLIIIVAIVLALLMLKKRP